MVPNYDNTQEEPTLFPTTFPNILVSPNLGIAVGMATNIPPHNLGEVIDGTVALIDNRDMEDRELLQYIKGPDFPGGGIILGRKGIEDAYLTGRGSIKVRSRSEIEPMNNGKHRIVVTEIPYQVNKARLVEKIAELARDKKIDGITDLRDESDRKGMRIVIELRRDVNPQVILNQLYKNTQLQDNFGVIMLALVDGMPKILTLKQALNHYIDHQVDVVTRRTKHDLRKAEERAHIVEGLKIAVDNIDEVIKIIRSSYTDAESKQRLNERFGLSDRQAQAVIEMQIRRLTGIAREKLEEELAELLEKIAYFKAILADETKLMGIIKEELLQIKEKHGALRWYAQGGTERIHREIVPKYEKLSRRICIQCGRPATLVSLDWTAPWCDACAEQFPYLKNVDIDAISNIPNRDRFFIIVDFDGKRNTFYFYKLFRLW